MNIKTHPHQRWTKIIALLAMLSMLLVLALIYTIQAADPEDFDHQNDISRTSKKGFLSGPPYIASGADTVAVVWADGYDDQDGTKAHGNIYLKSANETDGYWRPKVFIFEANSNNWGADPAFTFDQVDPTKVHVVWTEANSCAGFIFNCKFETIRYTHCDVSTNHNSCQPSQTIDNVPNVTYRTPVIAQDDQNNLHVVWANNQLDNVYYSRGIVSGDQVTWSAPSEVSQANNGKLPKLAFNNGRLHMAWDNETSGAGGIGYLYDAFYNNDILTATLGTVENFQPESNFANGDPGNPSLVVTGNDVFIAFDIEHPTKSNAYGLFYRHSSTGGDFWRNVRDIPGQNSSSFSEFTSNDAEFTGGLKPHLAITHTNSITWVHIVWQYDSAVGGEEGNVYQIYHAYRDIVSDFDTEWLPTIPLTVTNPPPTPGPTAEPTPTLGGERPPISKQPNLGQYAALDVQGASGYDSVEPALIITDLATGGKGKIHLAYLENPPEMQVYDIYYRGFIAGTIDPEYIYDEVTLDNRVVPTRLFTFTNPVPPQELAYTITFENHGNLNAVGVHITDTLDSELASITNLQTNAGDVAYNASQQVITWSGTISAYFTVAISFTGTTQEIVPDKFVRTNAMLWNIGGGPDLILWNDRATTQIRQYKIYMPVIFKSEARTSL